MVSYESLYMQTLEDLLEEGYSQTEAERLDDEHAREGMAEYADWLHDQRKDR